MGTGSELLGGVPPAPRTLGQKFLTPVGAAGRQNDFPRQRPRSFWLGRLCPPRDIRHPVRGDISVATIGRSEGLLLAPSGHKPGTHRAPATLSPGPGVPAPRPRARPGVAVGGRTGGRGAKFAAQAPSPPHPPTALPRCRGPRPGPLTDLVQGEQLIVGPDGSLRARAIDAHGQRVLPFAVDGGGWEPAGHVSPQRVLAVLAARFRPRAVPASGHRELLRSEGTTPLPRRQQAPTCSRGNTGCLRAPPRQRSRRSGEKLGRAWTRCGRWPRCLWCKLNPQPRFRETLDGPNEKNKKRL